MQILLLIKFLIFFYFLTDKLSIKTTVQSIVSAKQNVSIPDPKTREDFLKCKSFYPLITIRIQERCKGRLLNVIGMPG